MDTASTRIQAPVGALAAAVGALAFASYPLGPGAVIAAFFAAVLIAVAAIDLRSFTIPNRIVLPATVIVLAARRLSIPSAQASSCWPRCSPPGCSCSRT